MPPLQLEFHQHIRISFITKVPRQLQRQQMDSTNALTLYSIYQSVYFFQNQATPNHSPNSQRTQAHCPTQKDAANQKRAPRQPSTPRRPRRQNPPPSPSTHQHSEPLSTTAQLRYKPQPRLAPTAATPLSTPQRPPSSRP